jgi:hypothetical protein
MRAYRRFYVFFALPILISCVLWVSGVYFQLGGDLSPQGDNWWSYVRFVFKKERAESIESPKLIIMSGSNGLFGISTETLEEGLGVPSVNMAIHASFGLEYILYQTQSVVKSGDWILAPLEYGLYGRNGGGDKPTELQVDYVLAYDPNYLRVIGLRRKLKFIAAISIERFFSGLLRAVFPPSKTLEELPPLPLNRNGDATDNIGQKFDGVTGALEGFLLQKEGPNEAALRMLGDFIDECRRNGVQFLATYPSLLYNEAYLSETAREKIAAIEAFYASKNVPVLGTFEDFLYPIEDMYDTRYHLNAEGREKRTRLLLNLLKPYVLSRQQR